MPANAIATPVTPDLLPQFTQLLNDQRAALLAQIRQQRGGDISRADAAANARSVAQGDWAQNDAERDLAVTLEERELDELNQISTALQAIADGSYGSCVTCGADVGVARLKANPVALRCMACQTQLEQAHGQVHAPTL
ncbi:MAG: conjugal transfer protein TraR [Polaromonas sp.]|nr:conjugal transfer protein TraR [Polaromonas sp.]